MKTNFKALTALAITLAGSANAAEKFLVVRMGYATVDTDRKVMQEFNHCSDEIVSRATAYMTAACDEALKLTIERAGAAPSLLRGYSLFDEAAANRLGIAAAYSNAALAHWLTGDVTAAKILMQQATATAPQVAFVLSNGQTFAKIAAAVTPLVSN